jgi:hypothetical protein
LRADRRDAPDVDLSAGRDDRCGAVGVGVGGTIRRAVSEPIDES